MERPGGPLEHDTTLKELRVAVRDTTRLNRLFAILDDPGPLEAVADRALLALSELFAADIVALLQVQGSGSRHLGTLASIGLPEEAVEVPFSGDEEGYAAAVMRGRSPLRVDSAREDPRMDPRLRDLDVETAVWLPIQGSRGALGALVLAHCRPIPFSRSDGDLLMAMAHRIALVIERAAAEAERARLEALLRQAEKAESLGRMAGAIAHHINNKLTAVLGFLELATEEVPADTRVGRSLRRAFAAAEEGARVGQLMLAYLGKGIDDRERLEVIGACQEVLESLRAGLPRGIRLWADLPDPGEGPLDVVAGVGDLRRVLENLLQNALEALPGEGEVRLSLRKVPSAKAIASPLLEPGWTPAPGPYVCLEVSDTGPGMAPDILQNAFDPFFTTKFMGRGLGLPVVLGIVRAHRGTLSVDTLPGRGSTFRVFLPLSTERRGAAGAPSPPAD